MILLPLPPPITEGDARIVFPPNSGVLNVRDPRYGAKGDGKTDDTAAINRALAEGLAAHRIVYLPHGTYLVSDTLAWRDPANAGNRVEGWGPFLQMQGESRTGTIIRLKEGASGFGDPAAPKAILATGSSGSHGDKRYYGGEGNEAFENHLRHFTVDAGRNLGAVGMDWQASNVGAMRHVTVRGAGPTGIALTRRDNGPGLLKGVTVEGFRVGVRLGQEIAQFTFEDLILRNQTEVGFWAKDAVAAVRGLRSQNAVPAVRVEGVALVALFDSRLTGKGPVAVERSGDARISIRNLKAPGYAKLFAEGPMVDEARGLGLPVRATPDWYDADPTRWAVVGPPSGEDDTARVQKALDSGRATVFLGYGRYRITGTLRVPASIRRLQGAGTSLDGRLPADKPLVLFAGGSAKGQTIVDRIELGHGVESGLVFDHADARTLVLRDVLPYGRVYAGRPGAGPLFLEDIGGAGYRFAKGAKVWARSWNLEGQGSPKMVNEGDVWAFGTKHEAAETVWENRENGRLEVWSSLSYTFGADPKVPYAVNAGALSLGMAGTTYMPNGFYDLLVRDPRGDLRRRDVPGRGGGAFVLFSSGNRDTGERSGAN